MTKLNERSRNARILHVDDNRGDILLMKQAFKRAGIEVDIDAAGTAEEGLGMLHHEGAYAATPRPDVVLLDLNLPHMAGGDFLEIVKSEPELKRIPVIIMTSSTADADVGMSYDRHANGYISKPFSLDDYVAVAEKIEHYWFELMQCPPDNRSGRCRH